MKRTSFRMRHTPLKNDIDADGYFVDAFFAPADPSRPCCFVCFAQDVALSAYTYRNGSVPVRLCPSCREVEEAM